MVCLLTRSLRKVLLANQLFIIWMQMEVEKTVRVSLPSFGCDLNTKQRQIVIKYVFLLYRKLISRAVLNILSRIVQLLDILLDCR